MKSELRSSNGRVRTCFHIAIILTDFGTYRIRFGTCLLKRTVTQAAAIHAMEITGELSSLLGLVIVTFVVTGGLELRPGPSTEQDMMDQILTHERN